MNLLDRWEVKAVTQLDDHVSEEVIGVEIPKGELHISINILGEEMYDLLLADKAYTDYVVWTAGTYNEDAVVFYGRKLYRCTADGTTTTPGAAGWILQDKFNMACYNQAWVNGLREVFAYSVAARVAVRTTYRQTERGVIEAGNDITAMTGAGPKGVDIVQRQDLGDAMLFLAQLKSWIKKTSGCQAAFSKALFASEVCGVSNDKVLTQKRFGGRR